MLWIYLSVYILSARDGKTMSDNKMKIWKIVRVVTVVILLAFIVFVIQAMIRNYNYQGSYPYPAIGVDVHNWVEGTMIDVGIFFPFFIIPLTTAVILFIISCVKISRLSR